MLGCARPVRMMLKSSLATETALSIFSSASRSVSSIIVRLRCARYAKASLVVRRAWSAVVHGLAALAFLAVLGVLGVLAVLGVLGVLAVLAVLGVLAADQRAD